MFQQVSSQEKGEYQNCWSILIGLRAERSRGRPEPAFRKSKPAFRKSKPAFRKRKSRDELTGG